MATGAGRGAARRAVLQLTGARLISLAAMFVGLTVLARLLDPADFGTYALALAIYAVARTLCDGGFLQDAIRREQPMAPETLALAASIGFGLSVTVAAALIAARHVLPPDLASASLLDVLVPMALVLPVGALILQREAGLHRNVAFDVPARAGVVGTVAEVATGIALAAVGFGALALAWGLAAGVVTRAAVLMALSPGMRPVPPRLTELRPLARFSMRMVSVSLLPKVADLALLATLTGLAGAASTGLYNRAQRIQLLLDEVIFEGLRPMMLPVISAALRDGMRPAEVVATKHVYLVPIAFAGFGGTALLADPLIATLLGPGWEAAVLPVQILALAGLTMPVNKMALKLFTAIDRLSDYARIQNIHLLARLGLGAAGAAVSLEAFCGAMVLAAALKAALILGWERRHLGAPLRVLAATCGRGLAVAVVTLAGPGLLLWTTDLPPPLLLLGAVALALPTWLICLRVTDHPLAREIGTVARAIPVFRPLDRLR